MLSWLFTKLAAIEMTDVDMFLDENTNVSARVIRLSIHTPLVLEELDEVLLRSKRIAQERQQREDRQNTGATRE